MLLCLGLPWMLSTCFVDKVPMLLDTDGIMHALASLLFTALVWLGWMVYSGSTPDSH